MSQITEIDIIQASKDNFLTYASEVLTDRAIPSAEDGLLSAQRKILWTMEEYLNMNSKSKTKKCQGIVGSTLTTSYFHGDQACYGVLCKMSQPYLMRYPLVIGQGSLGTQEDNDMRASARYTEAKPSIYTDFMMNNFSKNVVPLKETYNGEFMEPVILPSLFPNSICNGRQSIGISMSHSSLPHNLTEVCNAIIAYIKNNNLSIDELMEIMPGPDFPLKNTIINKNVIKSAYSTGHSDTSLKVRGEYIIEDKKIIFTTIPYRTYRNKIKEQIENNIGEFEKILKDFNDESSLGENRLVFTLLDGVSEKVALNKIFALTDLQTTVSYNMNYIVNGTPKMCSMLDLIKEYIKHQEQVLINATNYDYDKASKKAHLLEGFIIVNGDIDKAINLIKNSTNRQEAEDKLIVNFIIDKEQAKAVLDMKLAKLTKMDIEDIQKELKELKEFMEECQKILTIKEYRDNKLINLISDLRIKLGDERRTVLTQINEPSKEEKEIVNVEPEKCVVIMTESGLIKRVPSSSFRVQKRNGAGIKTQDGITSAIIRTNTIDSLMVFTDKGRMYRILVDNIPNGTNASKGVPIKSLIEMEAYENPTLIYSIYYDTDAKYILFVTKNGIVKKTALDEYTKTKKKSGITAINLRENDELASVSLIKDESLMLITENGMGIKFKSTDIPASGRATMGVKGISLADGDAVASSLPIRNENDLIAIFTSNGLGKRIKLTEFVTQSRGGKGIICYKPSASTGNVVSATLVSDEDSLLVSGTTKSICINAKDISILGRTSMGVQVIKEGRITSVSKI